MVRHARSAAQADGPAGLPQHQHAATRRLGTVLRRLEPGVLVPIGFATALAWAFVGSLLLGLGTGATSRAAAWLWLVGELLIGTAVFLALLFGVPPGRDDT